MAFWNTRGFSKKDAWGRPLPHDGPGSREPFGGKTYAELQNQSVETAVAEKPVKIAKKPEFDLSKYQAGGNGNKGITKGNIPNQEIIEGFKGMSDEQIIDMIHAAYDSAHEIILKKTAMKLSKFEQHKEAFAKAARMESLGFTGTKLSEYTREQRKEMEKEAREQERILGYQKRFPGQKFITREQVARINAKYGLVCGPIHLYTGDIPDKNLTEIENWKWKESKHLSEKDIVYIVHERMYNKDGYTNKVHHFVSYAAGMQGISKEPLYISAVKKDMKVDSSSMVVDAQGFLQEKPVFVPQKDPIVLQPVNGGFLIISKWGKEAMDPIVANLLDN